MAEGAVIQPHGPWYRYLGLPVARLFLWILFTLLGPLRIRGRSRVPMEGGLLILSNHLSDVDPVVVQLACKRPIHFMAKSELFEMRLLGPLIRALRAFPVKRGEPDRSSMKHAIELLKMGEAVCIFPEGELSEKGNLLELKPGVALIARMSGASVICLGLRNTNRVLPYGSLVPRPALRLITANWSEPRPFGKDIEAEEILAWAESELRRLTGQPVSNMSDKSADKSDPTEAL
jgi:1-acyl-sn-glycerol-3-phosphate acyltransferase